MEVGWKRNRRFMVGGLHCRVDVCVSVCGCMSVFVCFLLLGPDEVSLSVHGNRPERCSSNDGYHCTNRSSDAVCFSHTYFASLSLIHLSPPIFSPLLTPPFQLCGTQTETNHRFNEIKFGGRPGIGTFVSHLLTAAAVAHLSHLTDSTVWYYFC